MTSPVVEVVIRPRPLAGLHLGWSLGCSLLMWLPWASGLAPVAASLVNVIILLGWRSGLNSLPCHRQARPRLQLEGRTLRFMDRDGPAETQLLPGSRVGTGWVLLRLRRGRQRLNWWIPAAALDASSFRRLRVLVRCSATEKLHGC
ncbi:MAG: protein YgfX [Steroidobacteraceae bacterium]